MNVHSGSVYDSVASESAQLSLLTVLKTAEALRTLFPDLQKYIPRGLSELSFYSRGACVPLHTLPVGEEPRLVQDSPNPTTGLKTLVSPSHSQTSSFLREQVSH